MITAHRRENFGDGILNICNAIKTLSLKFPHINFVYPVHPNPNIKVFAEKTLKKIKNVYLITPLNYLEFIHLMMKSFVILTDSGGVQEKPIIK